MRNTEFTNENLCKMTYGDVLDAIEQTDSNPFTGNIVDEAEWAAIAQCVNQGIDSHLEAITDAQEEFDNGSLCITPHNLCIILRRLSDTAFKKQGKLSEDEIWDAANTLLGSILLVLGFNDCGRYVGRRAVGLE